MSVLSKAHALVEPQTVTRKIKVKDENGNLQEGEACVVLPPGKDPVLIPEDQIVRQDDEFAYVRRPEQVLQFPLEWIQGQKGNLLQIQTPQGMAQIPAELVAGKNEKFLFVKTPPAEVPIPLKDFASTAGNLPNSSPLRGAFSGGLQGGYSAGFPAANPIAWGPSMVAGVFGGYLGVKEGERTDSLVRGLETGASVGAASAMAAAAASVALGSILGPAAVVIPVVLAGLFLGSKILNAGRLAKKIPGSDRITRAAEKVKNWIGKLDDKTHGHLGSAASVGAITALALTQPHLAVPLLYAALLGGMAGGVGTYAGTRFSNVRDREYGGYLLGLMARPFLPVDPLAPAVGGPVGAEGGTKVKQALLAFLPSAAMGAASGAVYGPHVAAISGLVSGILGAAGTLAGPKLMQAVRNINAKIVDKLTEKFDFRGREKKKAERILKGCLGGALMLGMFGFPAAMLMGLPGAVIPAAAGAIYFGLKVNSQIKKEEQAG